jgi:ABC-type branched-subunit amino acid transport system substrate-binding protein
VSPAGSEHDVIVFMEQGEIVDARFGDIVGVDAVRRALHLREGEFHVDLNVTTEKRTVFEPCNKLLLEELVSDDEAKNGANGAGLDGGPEEIMIPNTQSPPGRRGSSIPVVIIAAAVVAAAAVGGALWWRTQQEAAVLAQKEAALNAQRLAEARRPRVQGVTNSEIVFGMSAPFSGPAKELGRGMKTGIDLAFASANEAGGVNGRKLRLVALDDGYEPDRTRSVMKDLADSRNVFGFIGNVGTPTAEVAVPFTLEKRMLFFGPFTGAGLLRRDPPDRYVFNFRASYAEETAATVKYLVEVRRILIDEIAVFAQQDGYGDAGFNGMAKMLRKYNRNPEKALRVGYKRNTSDVGEAVETLLKSRHPVRAVVMVATYKAAAKFIEKVKAERPDIIFTNVSFVGSQALADELMAYGGKVADGVIVTQVVPLPQSKSTAVLKYQELLPKYSLGEKPDFVSLEGYLAANLLIEGLKRAGRDFTTESLIDALEGMRGVDLGVGATMAYGMSEHQASHKVWGTVLDVNGNFQNIDMD